jgi:hypothetical protein
VAEAAQTQPEAQEARVVVLVVALPVEAEAVAPLVRAVAALKVAAVVELPEARPWQPEVAELPEVVVAQQAEGAWPVVPGASPAEASSPELPWRRPGAEEVQPGPRASARYPAPA